MQNPHFIFIKIAILSELPSLSCSVLTDSIFAQLRSERFSQKSFSWNWL